MKSKLLFLSLVILLSCNSFAAIRYVSKTGSSTPPYLSWETASDSIQKCINISSFGDTIFVGNGVYKEVIKSIPGLALIGIDWDSTIIDTREFAQPSDFYAVQIFDNCELRNFKILVSNLFQNYEFWGAAVLVFDNLRADSITINFLNIQNAAYGILIHNCSGNFSYNRIAAHRGIFVDCFFGDYFPVISHNTIFSKDMRELRGVEIFFGSSPLITNNIINAKSYFDVGYYGSYSDSAMIYNNVVICLDSSRAGFLNSIVPTYQSNNLTVGNFFVEGGISVHNYNIVSNNIVQGSQKGILSDGGQVKYNNVYDTKLAFTGFTPDSTNKSVDPMFVDKDSLNFHLQLFSPLIDLGNPDILDLDNTRSDIGLYGGPLGEITSYLDYAPKPPKGLAIDPEGVHLTWRKNTEADFNHYLLYADSIPGNYSLLAQLSDTFFVYKRSINYPRIYFKLKAVDNHGKISAASEEVGIDFVSENESPSILQEYELFQNYPNPFNPTTTIGYRLKEGGFIKLIIYDLKGEEAKVLVNEYKAAGYYEVEFTAGIKNEIMASGFYMFKIDVIGANNITNFTAVKKMLLLK